MIKCVFMCPILPVFLWANLILKLGIEKRYCNRTKNEIFELKIIVQSVLSRLWIPIGNCMRDNSFLESWFS